MLVRSGNGCYRPYMKKALTSSAARTLAVSSLTASLILMATIPSGAEQMAESESANDAQMHFSAVQAAITATIEGSGYSDDDPEVDLWVTYDGPGQPTIHARTGTARAQASLEEAGETFHARVSVEEGEPFGATARSAVNSTSFNLALTEVPEVVGVGVDLENRQILVDVVEGTPAVDFERIEAILRRGAQDEKLNFILTATRGATGDSAAIYGGVALSDCTAGFTAVATGYVGFLTAAHCSSPQSYWDTPLKTGSSNGSATRRKTSTRTNADISYFSLTGNSISNRFFTTAEGNWVTTGCTAVPIEGNIVYSYGRTTEYRYGQITSTSYKPTWSDACGTSACNSTFVRVDAPQGGGDSGGPWYNQTNRPVGIHKGGSSTFSVYSKLAYLPSGVTIWRG